MKKVFLVLVTGNKEKEIAILPNEYKETLRESGRYDSILKEWDSLNCDYIMCYPEKEDGIYVPMEVEYLPGRAVTFIEEHPMFMSLHFALEIAAI